MNVQDRLTIRYGKGVKRIIGEADISKGYNHQIDYVRQIVIIILSASTLIIIIKC